MKNIFFLVYSQIGWIPGVAAHASWQHNTLQDQIVSSNMKHNGGRTGSLNVSREKETDKDFMAKMLKKEKKKKKEGEDSDDSAAAHSTSDSSSSSDEEDSGHPWRRVRAASSVSLKLKKKDKDKKTDVVKVRFNILLKLIVGLPSSTNDRAVYVSWKRGRKRQNRGETKHIRSTEGVVMWGESIWLEATMAATASSTVRPGEVVTTAPAATAAPTTGHLLFDKKNLILSIKREVRAAPSEGAGALFNTAVLSYINLTNIFVHSFRYAPG
jgi:hypothetical protein